MGGVKTLLLGLFLLHSIQSIAEDSQIPEGDLFKFHQGRIEEARGQLDVFLAIEKKVEIDIERAQVDLQWRKRTLDRSIKVNQKASGAIPEQVIDNERREVNQADLELKQKQIEWQEAKANVVAARGRLKQAESKVVVSGTTVGAD